MGGEGFLHPVVAFAKPFRIPDFFLAVRPVHGPCDRPGLAAVLGPPGPSFQLFLPALARHPVRRPVREDRGRWRSVAFAAHLAHALVEPYSSLWFIYLLAVFSVVTKVLRRVPGGVVLAAAPPCCRSPISAANRPSSRSSAPVTSTSSPATCSRNGSSRWRIPHGAVSASRCAASPPGRCWRGGSP